MKNNKFVKTKIASIILENKINMGVQQKHKNGITVIKEFYFWMNITIIICVCVCMCARAFMWHE